MFTNHNQLKTLQKKLQNNCRSSISLLGHMKKILHNFQWNPPCKTLKRDDRTLKTSSCEISFWALRRVSVTIVAYLLAWTSGKADRSFLAKYKFQRPKTMEKVNFRVPTLNSFPEFITPDHF